MPTYVWALIHVGPAAWAVYHALLHKRDPRAAMGWIMICLFVPFAGPIAYFFFGINRVHQRAFGRSQRLFAADFATDARQSLVLPSPRTSLREAGGRTTGRPISAGNEVIPLYNGESAYPAMLASIAAAHERVLLATYILKSGEIGQAFARELESAASRGVEVMVLVDGIGELYSLRSPLTKLTHRNVEIARFLPPKLLPPSMYINLRNHRKLLVVDDAVAYAGGMNISDEHTSTATGPRAISDIHFQLRGPVVSELSQVFFRDWHFATGASAQKPPRAMPAADGEAMCRVVPDGPDDAIDALALTIHAVISAASRSIDIVTPYFLPSRELTASLQSAALRGVSVRIVLPAENNLFYMHWAHRNSLSELLTWGIEVFYQPPPFCHSKLLCIDGDYALIGSANLDPRSLRLNFELCIEVFSEKFNAELKSHIEGLIAMSEPATYREIALRPVWMRLRDSAFALLSPYL